MANLETTTFTACIVSLGLFLVFAIWQFVTGKLSKNNKAVNPF